VARLQDKRKQTGTITAVLLLAPLISDCTNFTRCSKEDRQKERVVVTLKVKAANTLLTPFVRLLRNGHLSESEISQNIQRKYTTTSVKGQRKEGRKEGGRRRS